MNNLKHWMINNKSVVIFIAASSCLLVSTLGLVASNYNENCKQKNITMLKMDSSNHTQIHDDFYRLPRNIVPKNYELTLIPNLEQKKFHGFVTITINVTEPTRKIKIHSNKLEVYKIELKTFDDKDVSILSYKESMDKRELLIIQLKNDIIDGDYKLSLNFSGKLDNGIVGFYASNLRNGGTMVASKFQPTYARQAYPCFDEPRFKATYDITLAKPVRQIALSNMNEISKVYDPKSKVDLVTFATSVPMSTYLACFVICDFDKKSIKIDPGTGGRKFKLRAFAQKHEIKKINFALDIAKKATEFYINYYKVPFPLPKLDMIAIPDYVSGATEHWGLITYRETSFLIDEEQASATNKINVANTIAHELAHMWFGNLVTMKWWDEVWLNEGFATYMQVKALHNIEPSWNMLDHFLTKTLHPVLVVDSKLSSHPIVQRVVTPDEITAIFDTISYNKGASLLRMLEGIIGAEKFRNGIKDYLEKFKFGTTITEDLLTTLEPYFNEEHPDMDLTKIMDTWTTNMGYPVVLVEPGDEPNSFILSQSRFLLDHEIAHSKQHLVNVQWFVPITYQTNKGVKDKIIWLPNTDEKIIIKLDDDEKWLKINNKQIGYYRVNYDMTLWQALSHQIRRNYDQFTIADRAHLLDDAFAMAEARLLPYPLALNITTYLIKEDSLIPWEAAFAVYKSLETKLINTVTYNNLQKYFQRLVDPIYGKQNWEAENLPVMDSLLRTKILSFAARCQLPEAEERVKTMFLKWLEKKDTNEQFNIHQDLRDIVYFYGMKSATMREWDRLFEIYLNENDVQEKSKLRAALAAPRDTTLLRKFLLLAWNETNVRSQDYLNVIMDISYNPSGTALVWDHVRSSWQHLIDRFTLNSRYLAAVLPAVTKTFSNEFKYKEVEAFFSENKEAGAGELARKTALENIRNNIRWNIYQYPNVKNWLDFNCSNAPL